MSIVHRQDELRANVVNLRQMVESVAISRRWQDTAPEFHLAQARMLEATIALRAAEALLNGSAGSPLLTELLMRSDER